MIKQKPVDENIVLIPSFIMKQFHRGIYQGDFAAEVLSVDISGFTKMTQMLARNGKEGAEIITEIINRIFAPTLDLIHKHHGFVGGFAGDSYLSFFPLDDVRSQEIIQVSRQIQLIFKQIYQQRTRFGEFQFQIRLGLARGKVTWNIIKATKQKSYYFKGKVIERAIQAQKRAKPGELNTDNTITEHSRKPVIEADVSVTKSDFPLNSETSKAILQEFIPEQILSLNTRGEFRDVISLFVGFDPEKDFQNEFAQIIRLTATYGGYFNKIEYSYRTGSILILFGAPVSREHEIIRAGDLALAILKIPGFKCSIALTKGSAFTGYIGSASRSEYSALGTSVNLAARLLAKTPVGEIYIDLSLVAQGSKNYEIEFVRDFYLKGFERAIPAYRLISRKDFATTFISGGRFVGRQKELLILNQKVADLSMGDIPAAKITHICGKPGMGKSRLVKELKRSLDPEQINWIYLPCDNILKKSFHPFLFFLNNFFALKDNLNETEKEKLIRSKIETQFKNYDSDELKHDLEVGIANISAMLGAGEIKNFISRDAPGLFYENFISAVTALICLLTLEKPVILEFEDIHWIDSDSVNLIKFLLSRIENYPLLLLTTSVPGEDGKLYNLDLAAGTEEWIELDRLTEEEAIILINTRFHEDQNITGDLPEKTLEILQRKTQGNPFFIEHLIHYIKEKNLLDQNLSFVSSTMDIPSDINTLMISRIDKLDPQLKELARNASIFGKEFSDRALEYMTRFEDIKQHLDQGEKKNLWMALSDADHMFQNVFVRDSIYGLILKKELRTLHKLAAQAIEDLHKDDIPEYYADLAYNYNKAELFEKAVFYLEKAGDHAKDKFLNDAAMQYYDQILKITEQDEYTLNNSLISRIILNKIEVFLIKGDTYNADKLLQELSKTDLAISMDQGKYDYLKIKLLALKEDFSEIYRLSGNLLQRNKEGFYKNYIRIYLLNALRFLNKDKEFLEIAREMETTCTEAQDFYFLSRLHNTIGVWRLNKADYQEALNDFWKNYRLVRKLKNPVLEMGALHNMGIVYSRLGNRKKARQYYLEALQKAEKIGMKSSIAKLYSDLAIIATNDNDLVQAGDYYKKALVLAKDVGNRSQEGLIYYNLGELHFRRGNYDDALELANIAKQMSTEINDRIGITYANDLIGDILFTVGKIEESRKIYLENLDLQKELKDQEGICHTYGNLGNIAKSEEKYDDAARYYNYQQKNLAQIGDQEGEGKAWFNWAMVEFEQENFTEALNRISQSLKLLKNGPYEKLVKDWKLKILTELEDNNI